VNKKRGTLFDLMKLVGNHIMSDIRKPLNNSFFHKDNGTCQNNDVTIYEEREETEKSPITSFLDDFHGY